MKYYGGIDIGSTTTEMVVVNEHLETVFLGKTLTSGNIRGAGERILNQCLEQLDIGLDKINRITSTGYGRKYVPFAQQNVTEITCYAKGTHILNPSIRSVIDIGGQDSKVISLTDNGDVQEFAMNDKCAAGTGRFLEVMARVFDVGVDELGPMSQKSNTVLPISSICVVFAESEVISLISQEVNPEDIVNSIHHSIAEKTKGLSGRVRMNGELAFCGGVARNVGMVNAMKNVFGVEQITVPKDCDFVGALGGAILSAQSDV
ncbi:acyl-CoA dehydratase activase [Paenibacillus sp. TH7-28]